MDNAPELKTAAPGPATTAGPAAAADRETCCSSSPGSGGLNRRTLYIGIALAAAAGLFLGWDWLVAIGASALIISLLPCLVMCAFGICASRMCKDKTEGATKPSPANADVPVTKTAADDAPAPNTAPGDALVMNAAAHDVFVAKTAGENATNALAAESRT